MQDAVRPLGLVNLQCRTVQDGQDPCKPLLLLLQEHSSSVLYAQDQAGCCAVHWASEEIHDKLAGERGMKLLLDAKMDIDTPIKHPQIEVVACIMVLLV